MRVAVHGGKGQRVPGDMKAHKVKLYRSPRDGSWKDTERLCLRIRNRTVDLVLIFARFNSHGATQRVMNACRQHQIKWEMR